MGTLLQYDQSEVFQIYTGNIYLEFQDNLSYNKVKSLLAGLDVSVKRQINFARNAYFCVPQLAEVKNIFKYCEDLLNRTEVKCCHPELVTELRSESCRFSRPVKGHPSPLPKDWWLKKVDAKEAWKITKGKNVTIAIIDDGIEQCHRAFQYKIVHGKDMMHHKGHRPPLHRHTEKHGTPCASIACSSDPNAPGIAPEANVMPIRANSLGSIRQSEAIVWAVDNGADIISCSWGPPDGNIRRFDDNNRPYPIPDHLKRAFEYAAEKGRNGKGCMIIFAAGNGFEPISRDGYVTPDEVLAVTACNHNDEPTVYGDYGFPIHCAFPSGDFLKTPDNDLTLNTGILVADRMGQPSYEDGDYYSLFAGTSASCPGVAGVIAPDVVGQP